MSSPTTKEKVIGSSALLLSIFLFILLFQQLNLEAPSPQGEIPLPTILFPETILTANAAVVYDINNSRILFSKNAEVQLPLASLTKLMSASLANEILSQDEAVVATDKILETEGESGFRSGIGYSIETLLGATLIASSNDATSLLADAVRAKVSTEFTTLMNDRAQSLGMTQTFFTNPTGLDSSTTVAGSYGSAFDVAVLLNSMYENQGELLQLSRASEIFIDAEVHLSNTNEVAQTIHGLYGTKTGFTDLAGGNLAIVFDAGINRPIVIVVLGSTSEDRFLDVRKLVFSTINYFSTGTYDI